MGVDDRDVDGDRDGEARLRVGARQVARGRVGRDRVVVVDRSAERGIEQELLTCGGAAVDPIPDRVEDGGPVDRDLVHGCGAGHLVRSLGTGQALVRAGDRGGAGGNACACGQVEGGQRGNRVRARDAEDADGQHAARVEAARRHDVERAGREVWHGAADGGAVVACSQRGDAVVVGRTAGEESAGDGGGGGGRGGGG